MKKVVKKRKLVLTKQCGFGIICRLIMASAKQREAPLKKVKKLEKSA